MLVEITYACSMGCTHCLSDCKPDGEHMSLPVFRDSLDFMNYYKVPVWLFSGGEMFEHPDILEILNIFEEKWNKKSPVIFITNGRKLVRDKTIYEAIETLHRKYKKMIGIQITDDKRFYPDRLTDKEKYWLKKLGATIEDVPGDGNKCLYPQGRALDNYSDEYWNTIGPKCANVRLLSLQGSDKFEDLISVLSSAGKFCTPVISPTGSIKLGESALCPKVSSIYDNPREIVSKIRKCSCMKCEIPWNRLKESNKIAYGILTNDSKIFEN